MKYLYNHGEEKTVNLTENPITRPTASPNPLHLKPHELRSVLENPEDIESREKLDEMYASPNYSKAYKYFIRKGVNRFENDEQAEYVFTQFGGVGWQEEFPNGPQIQYSIEECDKQGNIEKGEFYKRHRARKTVNIGGYSQGGAEQFKEQTIKR